MPELRCKPGQTALIVRPSKCEPCSTRMVGVPVRVSFVISPITVMAALQEELEGPVWWLAEPLHCPGRLAGCEGITRMPDACLRPFDPESSPEPVGEQDERPSLLPAVLKGGA